VCIVCIFIAFVALDALRPHSKRLAPMLIKVQRVVERGGEDGSGRRFAVGTCGSQARMTDKSQQTLFFTPTVTMLALCS
jgi:hypothetical protein